MEKPRSIEEYKRWLAKSKIAEIDRRTEGYYNSVVNKIQIDFQKSSIWQNILDKMASFNAEYLDNTGYHLFLTEFKPELVTKHFDSFLLKNYRKNVLQNWKWPGSPKNGWFTPENWFDTTNDILRTRFIVKYLDGVEFLLAKIERELRDVGLDCDISFEARDEGYYALHMYTNYSFEIPKIDWDTEQKKITIEIQITTQLQDVISKLTHKVYEERRINPLPFDRKWQWNYQSDEFTTNYLGHILHYVEGMIMEVRNKQKANI
ncbi:MAG: hypothetical protein KF744_06970 [Taibaiella sp.]|nr:hypothetical protein [Taibaiella sp.]